MKIEIFWSDRTKRKPQLFREFIQMMANRLIVGSFRYGEPNKSQNYMTRMMMEMKAYKRTGNAEHLINIANYCELETEAPEHKKFHFDNTVGSVTRK